MKKHAILLCVFWLMLLCPYTGKTQDAVLDSLKLLVATATSDASKSNALTELNLYMMDRNLLKAIEYGRENLRLINSASELQPATLLKGYLTAGRTCILLSRYDSAELLINSAIAFSQRHNLPDQESIGYTDLGMLEYFRGDNPKSITNYIKAKEIAVKYKLSTARINGRMGFTYRGLRQYDQALHYMNVGIHEAEKENLTSLKYSIMGEVALVCLYQGKYDSAKLVLSQIKDYQEARQNSIALCRVYANLANIARIEENYHDQFVYATQVKRLALESNYQEDLAVAYIHMAQSKYFLKDFDEARGYAKQALDHAAKIGSLSQQKIAIMLLARIAMYNHHLSTADFYFAASDSIENLRAVDEQKKVTAEIMTRYETEKKEQENQSLRNSQAQQKKLTAIITSFAAILLVMLGLLFRSLRNQRSANAELKQKNQLIEEHREEILTQNHAIEQNNAILTKTLNNLHDTQAQLLHAEKMSSLGQLTAGIAHEINNPINFISAGAEGLHENLELLKEMLTRRMNTVSFNEGDLSSIKSLVYDIQEFGRVIRSGCERTEKIVAGLQTFSHKGAESLKESNPVMIIKETLMLIHGTIVDRIVVTTEFDPNLPFIRCKPIEIGQALLNILMNAAQSISGKGTIHISAFRVKDSIIITIKDSGSGIRPEDMSKVFDPFFTTKDVGKGTGLGLAITHGIIANHKGDISFESTLDVGTVCTIVLPI